MQTKYKPYPKYKPSGVEWIGEIPEGWEVRRLKFTVKYNLETISENIIDPNFEIEYLDIGNVNDDGKILSTEKLSFRDAPSRARRVVKNNDIIISTVRTYLKAIAHLQNIPDNMIVSTGFAVFSCNNLSNSRYFFYLFRSTYFIEQVVKNSKGVGYPAITPSQSPSNLVDIFLVIPLYYDQKKIAAFLDHEIARINSIVAKQTRLIELLKEKRAALITQAVTKGIPSTHGGPATQRKMKPSGVEWIGEIPVEFEIIKLKFITKTISKGTTPSTEGREILKEGNIKFIKAENIIQSNLLVEEPSFFIDEKTNKILKRSILADNDILIVIAGATIGKVAVMKKEFLPANTNQAVCFIRTRPLEYPVFLWYALQSDFIQKMIWLNAVQSAQPNLAMGQIKNFEIPFPPLPEQLAITNYLDYETTKIDTLISKIEKQIKLLNEYKQSLITHAVTGKIDVRTEVAINQTEEASKINPSEVI